MALIYIVLNKVNVYVIRYYYYHYYYYYYYYY